MRVDEGAEQAQPEELLIIVGRLMAGDGGEGQVEKLANLDQIPRPTGFHVSCLPVKIKDASAAWCRAVALVAERVEAGG
jgi:kynurenine formamidase